MRSSTELPSETPCTTCATNMFISLIRRAKDNCLAIDRVQIIPEIKVCFGLSLWSLYVEPLSENSKPTDWLRRHCQIVCWKHTATIIGKKEKRTMPDGTWNCPCCQSVLSGSQSPAECLTCARYAHIQPELIWGTNKCEIKSKWRNRRSHQ